MMTMKDLEILNKCYEEASKEMAAASAAIAEKVCDRMWPTKDEIDRYRKARISAESTRRDLEYCIHLELAELLNT